MKGMILEYISSNGQTYDLKVGKFRTRNADYHDYAWLPQTIQQRFGTRVYRFDKSEKTYTTTLSVFGSLEEKKTYLNLLHAAFEHDIVTMTPGRITHGMYSIDCFIIETSTYYEDPWTQNTLIIYCPYPFWRRNNEYHLTASEADEYAYLDFPYDFMYDYQATLPGYAMIMNPGVKPADWILSIKGYALNPMVIIGGTTIGVNAVIGTGETLIISSHDKTVKKVNQNGTETNLFNARNKNGSIFDPFPAGELPVMWSGAFDVDLTVFEERSEPLWI